MARAFVLLLDSFGVGAAADAADFGDVSANTLGSIAKACAAGLCDDTKRQGYLKLPNMQRLGLGHVAHLAAQEWLPGLNAPIAPTGAWGCAQELSRGKDTPSGHWEIAGVPVLFDWGYFTGEPSFPVSLVEQLCQEGNIPGILGDCHASGTEIIDRFGAEHLHSGKPIIYTSADSVLQIAAHEESFGLERLYALCAIARRLVDPYNIGRVIARPFLGSVGGFYRTGNRRDLAVPPPAPTLLDYLKAAGHDVIAIGKVSDIYAHQGITQSIKANGNTELFDKMLTAQTSAPAGSLIFTNFVDFDMLYGHRRDIKGYATALEYLDQRLPEFLTQMQADDIAVITADHGCDPAWPGSDHTREYIPVIFFGPKVTAQALGIRSTFADIGQTLAQHLGVKALDYGTCCVRIV